MTRKRSLRSGMVAALAVFALAAAGCDGFNNPLKPFISESLAPPGSGNPGGLGGYGDGTAIDPFLISEREHLERINSTDPSYSAWTLSAYYELVANIDLSVSPWVPIGSSPPGNGFSGHFNGNGHTINGLTIDSTPIRPGGDGLFGYVATGGVVRNLGLTNVDISVTSQNVGGIAGNSRGTIVNSFVEGTITGVNFVGGIVGRQLNPGRVQHTYAKVTVTITNSGSIGGIAGGAGGTVEDNVVLYSLIDGASATHWRRVVGDSWSATLSNNHVSNSGTALASVGVSERDGADSDNITNNATQWGMAIPTWGFGTHWEWHSPTDMPQLRTPAPPWVP